MSKTKIFPQFSKDLKPEQVEKWACRIWKDHKRHRVRLHFDVARQIAPQAIKNYQTFKERGLSKTDSKNEALSSVRKLPKTSTETSRHTRHHRWQHDWG